MTGTEAEGLQASTYVEQLNELTAQVILKIITQVKLDQILKANTYLKLGSVFEHVEDNLTSCFNGRVVERGSEGGHLG